MNSRLNQLEQRVFMLEQAIHRSGIILDESTQPQVEELEEVLTPTQLRAAGNPYCPKCYTFGHNHRKDCPYVTLGMTHHVKDKS